MIVAQSTYLLICALLTAGVAAYWILVDSFRLRAALRADAASPVIRDQRFGSVIGILVGIVGVFGIAKYYFM